MYAYIYSIICIFYIYILFCMHTYITYTYCFSAVTEDWGIHSTSLCVNSSKVTGKKQKSGEQVGWRAQEEGDKRKNTHIF